MNKLFRNRKSGLGYFILEGVRYVVNHRFMSFAAITIIAACFLITAIFALLTYNIDVAIEGLGSLSEITIFIDENVPNEQAAALLPTVKGIHNVDDAVFVTKEEFLEEFIEDMGTEAAWFDDLRQDNPLRAYFRITMEDISLHEETLERLEALEGVANIRSDVRVSQQLVQIRNIVNLISSAMLVLLGAVCLFIISNIVRIAMFARREEIGIMRMVGATNTFISAPFAFEGIVLGILSAVIAFFALWGVYYYLGAELMGATSIISIVPFEVFRTRLALLLLALGVFIGVVGSLISLRRFLKV